MEHFMFPKTSTGIVVIEGCIDYWQIEFLEMQFLWKTYFIHSILYFSSIQFYKLFLNSRSDICFLSETFALSIAL